MSQTKKYLFGALLIVSIILFVINIKYYYLPNADKQNSHCDGKTCTTTDNLNFYASLIAAVALTVGMVAGFIGTAANWDDKPMTFTAFVPTQQASAT